MLQQLTINIIIFLLVYTATSSIGYVLGIKNKLPGNYRLTKDLFIYLVFILLIGFISILKFAPDFQDILFPVGYGWLPIVFLCAGLIYALFLLEMPKLMTFVVFASSVACSFLIIKPSVLPQIPLFPPYIQILCIGLIFGCITFASKLLIGLTGIFSLIFSMLSLGLILLSYVGGLPILLGFMATALFAVFISIFQFNKHEMQLPVNEGFAMALAFIFGSVCLHGINELALSSLFILVIYFLIELLWSLFKQYILQNREPDLYFNTIYFTSFQRGWPLFALQTLLFKLCLVNIVLAQFQLFMPNPVTLPFLAFLINAWLLSKMYTAQDNEPVLPHTKEEPVQPKKRKTKGQKS